MKMTMHNKTILFTAMMAAMPVLAQVSNINLDQYQQYLGRKGVEIHGSGTGNLLFSKMSDASPVSMGQEHSEKLQTTWFDIDMKYRPKDWATAHLQTRFHQDWQSFFMARSRPISFLHASIDGKTMIGSDFGFAYSVGDFKEKYSPLSLWSPELDILGEPKIFKREREESQLDYVAGDNQRRLQGINTKMAYKLSPGNELRIKGLFSQVKRAQYLDKAGKDGSEIAFADYTQGDFTDFNAFAYTANAEAYLMDAFYVAGGYQEIWEDPNSFNPYSRIFAGNDPYAASHLADYTKAMDSVQKITDPSAQKTYQYGTVAELQYLVHNDSLSLRYTVNNPLKVKVINYRAGVDVAKLISSEQLIAELEFDGAKSTQEETALTVLPNGMTAANVNSQGAASLAGNAMLIRANVGYKIDSLSKAVLALNYMKNDANFRNPLAQTPTFLMERIYHVDGMQKANIFNMMVSPLDAMYYSVYNYTPNPRISYDTTKTVASPSDGYASQTGVEPYQYSTYHKNAYTDVVLFRQNVERLAASGLQEVLPFGFATNDRSGFGVDAKYNMGTALSVRGLYGAYKGVTNTAQSFNEMGVALHVEPLAFATEGDDAIGIDLGYQTNEGVFNKSNLMQAGASWRFWDRVGILGGYQAFTNKAQIGNPWYKNAAELEIKHLQWMGGLEYEFSKGFYAMAAFGKSSVENPSLTTTSKKLEQTITNVKVRASF